MIAAADAVNWTQVLVYGIPAWIAAVFAGLATLRVHQNARQLRTPSGDNIGSVVERAQDLSALAVAAATGAKGPSVDDARRRLNGGKDAALTTMPETPKEPG